MDTSDKKLLNDVLTKLNTVVEEQRLMKAELEVLLTKFMVGITLTQNQQATKVEPSTKPPLEKNTFYNTSKGFFLSQYQTLKNDFLTTEQVTALTTNPDYVKATDLTKPAKEADLAYALVKSNNILNKKLLDVYRIEKKKFTDAPAVAELL
jgi:hypothetical protein